MREGKGMASKLVIINEINKWKRIQVIPQENVVDYKLGKCLSAFALSSLDWPLAHMSSYFAFYFQPDFIN